VARVPKITLGNISLARGIQSCPFFFNFFRLTRFSSEEYVYIHIADCRHCIWITAATK